MKTFALIMLLPFIGLPAIAQKPEKAFKVTLKLTAITVSHQYDADGNIISKTERQHQYSVQQGLKLNQSLLQRLQDNTQKIDLCSSEQMCVLLSGNSRALDVNLPVIYTTSSTLWEMCDGKLVKTQVSQGGGTLQDYMLSTHISVLEHPSANDLPQPVPLVPLKDSLGDIQPVPLVNPHYYVRLFVGVGGITPNINATAPRLKSSYYDCTTKQWTDNTDTRYGISVPDFSVIRSSLKAEANETFTDYYINPLFNEKELFGFLSRPVAGKTFRLSSRSYHKEANSDEQTDIYIELGF